MDTVDNLTLELWGLERLLNINELAAYLRVPVSTIYEWRTKGAGASRASLRQASDIRGRGCAGLGRRPKGDGWSAVRRLAVTR